MFARLLAVFLLVSAVLRCPAAVTTTAPLSQETYFGINGIGYFHRPTEVGEVRRRVELLRELGMRWDRSDFWWSDLERKPGEWNYSKGDAAMKLYRDAGIRMLPILCYGAAWRDTQGPSTPDQLEEWRRYVTNVTSRYQDSVRTWEVWNEPNIIPFWRPQPDPDAYVRLLKATRAAAPRSDLVGMVLADLDHDYLERVLQVAGTQDFDKVSYHFYRIGQPEERTPDEVAELKLMLLRYGKDCPIWVTEMGVTSYAGTEGVSEEMQAIYWMRQILLLIAAGVERVFPFCLVDNITDPGGPWGSQLGMITLDGRKKPAFFAYKTMVAELQDYQLVGPVSLGEHVYAYLFQRRAEAAAGAEVPHKLVAWTTRDVRDIRIGVDDYFTSGSASPGGGATTYIPAPLHHYTTLLGERKRVELDGPTQRVMLSASPVYLPVRNQHLIRDARTAVEPANLMVSPGQHLELPEIRTSAGDLETSTITLPDFCKRTADGFLVSEDPPEGWHSIRYTLTTTSGTIEKQARLWVQPRTKIQARPFAGRTSEEILTSFTVTSRSAEPVQYRFTIEPTLNRIELPHGSVGGILPGPWAGSPDGIGPFFQQASVRFPKAQWLAHQVPITIYAETTTHNARERTPIYRFATLPLLSSAPILDGQVDEYPQLTGLYLGEPSQVLTAEWREKHFTPQDASATVHAAWTAEGLYVAAEVTDDHPMINPQAAGPDIYKGDGVEIYLGTRGYKGEHYSDRGGGYYHFALSPGRGGDGAVVSDFERAVDGAEIVTRPIQGGYVIEAFIPSSAIGAYTPTRGDVLAWDVQLNDRDNYAEPSQQKALMWNGDHLNWLRAGKWGMAVVN